MATEGANNNPTQAHALPPRGLEGYNYVVWIETTLRLPHVAVKHNRREWFPARQAGRFSERHERRGRIGREAGLGDARECAVGMRRLRRERCFSAHASSCAFRGGRVGPVREIKELADAERRAEPEASAPESARLPRRCLRSQSLEVL